MKTSTDVTQPAPRLPTGILKRLLINRNFALLWSGRLISLIGDLFFGTTLVLWIATQIARNQSWAPLAIGGYILAASLPAIIISPIAGVFVDRWDKRKTMLVMDILRAIIVSLLLLVTITPVLGFVKFPAAVQISIVYLTVILMSSCSRFFGPSVMALIRRIVDKDDRTRASALQQSVGPFAAIAFPPLAALLFFSLGIWLALALNALSFVLSFLCMLSIRVPAIAKAPQVTTQTEEEEPSNFRREMVEGFRFFRATPGLMVLLISIGIILCGEAAYSTLGVFFVTRNLHVPLAFFGFLEAATAAGLTISTFTAALIAKRVGLVRTFWLSLVLSGIVAIIYSRMTSFIPALIVLFIYGYLVALQNIAIVPIQLALTPEHLMGRVMSVFDTVLTVVEQGSVVVISLFAVALQSVHIQLGGVLFGPYDTLFAITGLLFMASGIYALIAMRGVSVSAKDD